MSHAYVADIAVLVRVSSIPLNQDVAQVITRRNARVWRAVTYTAPAEALGSRGSRRVGDVASPSVEWSRCRSRRSDTSTAVTDRRIHPHGTPGGTSLSESQGT
jgi:hypothetical protein